MVCGTPLGSEDRFSRGSICCRGGGVSERTGQEGEWWQGMEHPVRWKRLWGRNAIDAALRPSGAEQRGSVPIRCTRSRLFTLLTCDKKRTNYCLHSSSI